MIFCVALAIAVSRFLLLDARVYVVDDVQYTLLSSRKPNVIYYVKQISLGVIPISLFSLPDLFRPVFSRVQIDYKTSTWSYQ